MSRADVFLAGIDPYMAGLDPYMGAEGLTPVSMNTLAQRLNIQRATPAAAPQRVVPMPQGRVALPQDTRNLPAVPLPVDSVTAVLAGTNRQILVTPVSDVRITDFTVATSIAPNFVITGILFGRMNQFVGAGAVPAERFMPNSNRPPMEVTRVPAGTQISVLVSNISGQDIRFVASFDCLDLTYLVGR